MRRLRDLSVRVKLLGSFGAVVLLLVAIAATAVVSLGALRSDSRQGARLRAVSSAVQQVRWLNEDISLEQFLWMWEATSGQPWTAVLQQRGSVATDRAKLEKALAKFPVSALTGAERSQLVAIRRGWSLYWQSDARLWALYSEHQHDAQAKAYKIVNGPLYAGYLPVVSATDALLRATEKRASALDRASADGASSSIFAVVLVALLAIALAVGIAFALSRSIKRRVDVVLDRLRTLEQHCTTYVREGLEALADGDLTERYAPVTSPIESPSKDEIGQVATAVNGIRDRIVASLEAYNTTADRLSDAIGQVAQTAGRVGESSRQMASTSEESGRATGEIAHAVSDVAAGAERQVRMIEDARSSADEVVRAVEESAEEATQTAQIVQQAREAAHGGVGAAAQADDAMRAVRASAAAVTDAIRGLASSSEKIGEIVQTITGIAEQTNLLALNAAIEAARAGEQGRGFAVVAEEVRKLAEESQHASAEIAQLIGAIQADTTHAVGVVEDGAKRTEDGAAVVEQTREAFELIGSSVEDVSGRIEHIASASHQIATSAQRMQSAIGEIAAVAEQSSASTEEVSASTQETSASAEQIAASAQELSGNAERLNQLVAKFKVANT
jgi:methyl-accepting chemotaxis protein